MFKLAVNFRLTFYLCGWVTLFLAAAMLVPTVISAIYDDGRMPVFFVAAAGTALWSAVLIFQGRQHRILDEVKSREGLATVGLAWLMVGLLGSLPYWLDDCFPSFYDALFESFSGFSTTGATVAADVEALAPSILFWRSFTHWLGGMGIIVLMLAVLPSFGLNGVQLFKNENSFAQQKLKPRMAQTAKILWRIYAGLTIALIGFLLAGGLNWPDAIGHAFSTVATGGFSNKNASMGHYGSAYLEIVLTVFMIIASLNFALYYQIVCGDWKNLVKNTEARVFLLIILVCSVLVFMPLLGQNDYANPADTLRHAFFQVVSVISTTGFTTFDWEQWPNFCKSILFVLFFVGGCSGSTSGGMKCIRWVLLFKGIHRTLRKHIHPKAVQSIHLAGRAVPEEVMTAVWSFGAIYLIFLFSTSLALTAMDIDILTAFSASAATLGNVGLGLGSVGPTGDFGHLPGLAKVLLSFNMFLGRLEFFSLLILFMPDFWKK